MFKPGSNQKPYTLCSQYDDALDLHEIADLPEGADQDTIDARNKAITDRNQRLKVARERSDWTTLIKPGGRPSFFHFRHIPGSALDWWHGQDVGDVEKQALLFRLALTSVENLGDVKMRHEDVGDVRILSAESLDYLYAIGDGLGRKVVGELASLVATKTFRGVDPLY